MQRFGTRYRYRDAGSGRLDGGLLPVDLAANAESLGVRVLRAKGIDDLRSALDDARRHEGGPVMVHIETDPLVPAPGSGSWWDVPVAEVSRLDSTREARKTYDQALRWLERNKEALAKDRAQAEELRRFRDEAEAVLELKKK